MRNFITITVLFIFVLVHLESAAQVWDWANGTRGCNNYAHFSASGTSDDVYVCGETFSGMDFTTDTIKSIGYTRVYLSKFDTAGNLKWVKTNTGNNTTGRIGVLGLTSDLFGNEYLLGAYDTVISFDGNTLRNSYLGSYTDPTKLSYLFLAKFDTAGNNEWVKSVGDFPYSFWNIGNSLRSDCAGNLYLISNFSTNAHIGSYYFPNYDTSEKTHDMLVAKLDSSGNTVWAKHFGNDSDDYVVNIGLTPSNDIYLTGSFFHYEMIFGSDTLTDTSGLKAMATTFITKLDNAGNVLWAKKNGDGTYAAYISDIAVNSSSEMFTLGYYSNNFTLDTYTLPYGSGSYSYLAKYDASGGLLWAKTMKGTYVYSEGVTLDGCDNAWVLGHFGTSSVVANDTMDGHIINPPVKNLDPLFISGWSSAGSYIGTSVLPSGGRSSDKISIVTGKDNTLYIIGNNTLDTMQIASDSLYGTSGTTNMFTAKYDPQLACGVYYYHNCKEENPLLTSELNLGATSASINIYPNPTSTECTISCADKNANCYIYDITGRLIKMYALKNINTKIPVTDLTPGVYVFKIEAANTVTTFRKVVVSR